MTVDPCPRGSDTSLGPVVNVNCRPFDFTLLFEDVFVACIPSLIFLSLHVVRTAHVVRKPAKVAPPRQTLYFTALYVLLFGSQLALLAVRRLHPTLQTSLSTAAQALQAIDTGVSIFNSNIERARSVRPPIWPNLHLFVTGLLDTVRVRTFWLASKSYLAPILISVTLGLRISLLILESTTTTTTSNISRGQNASKEDISNLWGLCFLTWVLPVLKQGLVAPLTLEQVPLISQNLRAEELTRRLRTQWEQVYQSRKNQLFVTVFWTFKTEFLKAVLPRLCYSAFTLMQPCLVNALIKFVDSPENPMTRNKGYGLIGASAIVYIGLATSKALYNRQAYRFVISVRGALLATVYSRTLELGVVEQGSTSAITLMGTDVERIATGFRDVHEIWASPIDIGLAVWLLGRQLAVSCAVPVALSLSELMYLSPAAVAMANPAQRSWIERVQFRIDATRQMLNDLKSIKLLGLGTSIESIISRYRSAEIATSRRFRSLLCWEVSIANFSWLVSPAASFTLFTVLSAASGGSSLNPAQAFTALSLMSMITLPVLTLIQALPALFQCLGSLSRLQEYFSQPHALPLLVDAKSLSSSTSLLGRSGSEVPSIGAEKGPLISIRNATVKWSAAGPEALRAIDLDVHKGDIIAVMGPVSAGKTTLLESILGETVVEQGYIHALPVPTAYCTQVPWLVEGSVRENIVGPLALQPEWYHQVLWMCGVSEDLQALPKGDLTPVGGQGNALSGGQKQRVALARAVYSRCEVVVLDDVFSGLDPVTRERICQRLLDIDRGYFRRQGTTVLFSTHHSKVAALADQVLVLENGRIMQHNQSEATNRPPGAQTIDLIPDEDTAQKWPLASEACLEHKGNESDSNDDIPEQAQPRPSGIEAESGYSYYLKSTGRRLAATYVILVLVASFCQDFPNLWLKWWSSDSSNTSNQLSGMYLGVFIAFAVGTVVVGAAGSWVYLIRMISNSAERLHGDLLSSMLRFSQDLELVDMTLPLAAVNATKALGACLLKMVILFVVAKYMSLAVPPLLLVCYVLQKCYTRTSRQVRLLAIEAKAPLFQHLSEALSGGATIRAFGWQGYMHAVNLAMVDDSQKCTYTLFMIQQWLTLAMDLLASGLIVLLTLLTVFMRGSFDAGSSGTAVVTLMSFTQELSRVLKFWTLTESCLGAVSRIQSFAAHTPSETGGKSALSRETVWPSRGAIELQGVTAAYKSTPILNSVSLHISPGQKVALCGRSGSGKSSLLLCLGGLLRPQSGSIHIDGVDLASLSPKTICSRLSVVPQEPCYLPGTIRFNIDPAQTLSEGALARVLQTTHLTGLVTQLGGLDAELDPARWSAGQGQLLALARAMARNSRVLVLDEAMSRVDQATQSLMDSIISEEFVDCTVISIVHRYENISWFDTVAVMENGVVVEFDRPAILLARETRFRHLYTSSGCG
ncbi:P-loop containing nucleoside triphosphate hydrolase protein [Aspergillus saccharolyticus JOP 1030-1]|uniref:P-loop containing nucleoside triphosphate hydrolase protein n=1 Tax=Aspergillus saccharolyticus JOP 1030-1 TaxID=1450539 RepID=A0A318Z9L3_9EURO|nr:P-loop containing nucleoside triphosphate hydrolase protein [Aspergillus saccharolyticus JOP 1030-1]PYH44095.1 P-loop containing nucleoside triphosphate hydrolase protein [Aspergillus saccharolyticus JOP 1030-1]